MTACATLLVGEISQGIEVTCFRCDGFFNNHYCKFTAECISEEILKIIISKDTDRSVCGCFLTYIIYSKVLL